MKNYTCPIHGLILEDELMYSAGGVFCGKMINNTDEVCSQPLEITYTLDEVFTQPLELNSDTNISQ